MCNEIELDHNALILIKCALLSRFSSSSEEFLLDASLHCNKSRVSVNPSAGFVIDHKDIADT